MASAVAQFLEAYRSAYQRRAAEDVADLFSYPSFVISDASGVALVPNADRRQWVRQVEVLLSRYDAIGAARIELLELEEKQLSPHLWLATVHWGARDGDGGALYDFHNLYVLGEVDGALRIMTAVSPDELPRYRACRERLGR